MAGQSVEASAEMLKNAVIDEPTAEHTATVGNTTWIGRITTKLM